MQGSQHQGKSGNLFCFLGFRENQGIIFFLIIFISVEWSGTVREFVQIQVKHCVFFYVKNKICISQIKICSDFPRLATLGILVSHMSLHRMIRFTVAVKACELACINPKLLHLYMNICPEARESHGKFALKSQGKSGIFSKGTLH